MDFFKKPVKEVSSFDELIKILFYIFAFYCLTQNIGKGNIKKKIENKIKNTFTNSIIGLKSVKEEINYYMDFIKNQIKYQDWDVKLPKGILLAGPPGTGKTLLVKSMAKDLDLPVISASGSEFVEKYVGVGASRIRKLFKKAKTYKKGAIIFIDEIDAIGMSRNTERNSERATTLNQLLVEMDGFNESENIIVFAATNLTKTLDPALLRSGRFDKKVFFDKPNFKEREELYKLYLKDVELPDNISYKILGERSAGMTGADIANISNQAKINAIQEGAETNKLTDENIQEAIDEVMIGREKRERMMTKKERERVSHHEAGHALMGYLLKNSSPPVKVSIIPRGEIALGFSQPKPEQKQLYTREEILSMICVLLGGRVAEKVIYNNISTGAADDIEKISDLMLKYNNSWGMNDEIGPLNNFNKKDSFKEAQKIIKKLEAFADNCLRSNIKYVKIIAEDLLNNETIVYDRIKELLPEKLENSLTVINV
jgi:cell division protease FtsH